jgi:hypothetical protein
VARSCPHCKSEISLPIVAAYSNDVVCPKCETRLEVSSESRTLSSLAGLLAGAIVWKLSEGGDGNLHAVAPTLYAFLAFGIVSPLALMFTARLQNAPEIAVAEPAHSSAAPHGGGHH